MSFMYLHLRYGKDANGMFDGVYAKIEAQGKLKFESLGTQTSRWSNRPLAVFQIMGFDGLENIETNGLLEELYRRFDTPVELAERIKHRFTTAELFEILQARFSAKGSESEWTE